MPKNTITDLRNHLFETIEKLVDKEDPMDIERAKAVSTLAQTIIDSARVEVKMLEAIGKEPNNSFFDGKPELTAPSGKAPQLITQQVRS